MPGWCAEPRYLTSEPNEHTLGGRQGCKGMQLSRNTFRLRRGNKHNEWCLCKWPGCIVETCDYSFSVKGIVESVKLLSENKRRMVEIDYDPKTPVWDQEWTSAKANCKQQGVEFEALLSSFYVKEECHSPFLCHFDKVDEVLDVYSKIVDGDTSDKEGYLIFMVRYGQFPENGQRQMAYINNFHWS